MSFAGHIKSKSLFNGTSSSEDPDSLTLAVKIEKAALLEQVRQKERELQHLRNATGTIEACSLPDARSKLSTTHQDVAPTSRQPSTNGETSLVDDRGNEPSRSLWVGNTPSSIRSSDLRAVFGNYGSILSTKCLVDCCFVNFNELQSAIRAWKDCHEKEVFEHGRQLYIRFTNSQAESRRAKDAQFERTSFLHHPAHYAPDEQVQRTPAKKVVSSLIEKTTSPEWPNGSPPVGPRSQRRAISPPLLTRVSSIRNKDCHQHDIYRSGHELTASADETGVSRDSTPDIVAAVPHVGSVTQNFDKSAKERPEFPRQPESLPTSLTGVENRVRKLDAKAALQDHSALLADAKAKLLRKASLSGVLNQPSTSTPALPLSSDHADAEAPAVSQVEEVLPKTSLYEVSKHATPLPLLSAQNVEELAEPVTVTVALDKETLDEQVPGNGHIISYPPSLLKSMYRSPSMPPANKRLKLDRDDISSIRSDKSSLSNSSSRDRRCRGCKKLGNERGLHMLYKCASCTRRYHSFCGNPRPDQSPDPSKFVCEKCTRLRRPEQREAEPGKPEVTSKILQLASPPLSHGNYDLENGIVDQSQKLPTAFDLETAPMGFEMKTPPTPDEVFAEEITRLLTGGKPLESGSALRDGAFGVSRNAAPGDALSRARSVPEQGSSQKKYAGVTCPWWKKGNRCRLREDDCLYSHSDTGILSPDGYKHNRDWTCYYWLRRYNCPDGEIRCRYSHLDTGLHTWKDGRASLKHVTCFWWATRGVCKHNDDDCRYAHVDTGLYSPDPSDKRAGMAMSVVRPTVTLLSPSRKTSAKDGESGFDVSRRFFHNSPVAHDKLDNATQDYERLARPRDASESTEYEPESVISEPRMKLVDKGFKCAMSSPSQDIISLAQPSIMHFGFNGGWEGATSSNDIGAANFCQPGTRDEADHEILKIFHSPMNTVNDEPRASIIDTTSAVTDSGPSTSGPTKDPRKSLHLLQTRNLSHIPRQRPISTDVALIPEPATVFTSPKKPVLTRTPSESLGNVGASLPTGSSYKKCKVCAKTVFGKETCRECRLTQDSQSAASKESAGRSENITSGSATLSPTNTVRDDLAQVVEDDLQREVGHEQSPKPQFPSRAPGKRSVGGGDMFIPNKRPRLSLGSVSITATRTSVSGGDRTRKLQPPTINQLLEKRRLEKGSKKSQPKPLNFTASEKQVNKVSAEQSDKENETPITEDGHSPLIGTPTSRGHSYDDNLRLIKPEPGTTVGLANHENVSVLESHEAELTVKTFNLLEQSDEAIISSFTINDGPVDASDDTHQRDDQDSDDVSRMPQSIGRNCCTECASKHKRCTHRYRDNSYGSSSDELSYLQPAISINTSLTSVMDIPGQRKSRQQDGPVSAACKHCRSQHRRCLHTEDGSRLDRVKCQQYLKDRCYVKDTSRSYTEREDIITAAQRQHARYFPDMVHEIQRSRIECSDDISTTSSSTSIKAHAVDSTALRLLNVEDNLYTLSPQEKDSIASRFTSMPDAEQQSIASGTTKSCLQMDVTSKLKYDQKHICELKAEGVMFESDEDEADYISDTEQPFVEGARLFSDPLRVPPLMSQDLYELCPELHPERVRHLNFLREARQNQPKVSKKVEWANLRASRLDERKQIYGNPHWEVRRKEPEQKISTIVERLVPILDEELSRFSVPCVEKQETLITFQDFLGAPRQPEACLAMDGALAFKDGAKDSDQTSFARSARGLGRRATDEDKFPVYER